ncbi:MAG: fibronectin type III domain-containing protein [Planctomycetes bacterium]|nr:fibronectin type III domain-containing protein [Planctomycetota bacterium]
MLSVSLGGDDLMATTAEFANETDVTALVIDDPEALLHGDAAIDFSPWTIEYAEMDLDFERSRVAVDGDVMVVGMPLDDSLAENAGLVHVYRHSDGAWRKDPTSLISPRGEADRLFGNRVALKGERLFVTSASTVYIFRAGPLGTWQLEAELIPSSGGGLGQIDTDGRRLIVSTSSFSATVFSRDGEVWREEATLSIAETVDAPSQSPYSLVAIDGDTAVLRADVEALPEGMKDQVHVFEFVEGVWTERQQLVIGDQNHHEDVTSVAIDGDTIAIVIQSDSAIDLYHRGEDGWQRSTKLRDPGRSFLGAEIVLHGDMLVLSHYSNRSPTSSTSGDDILGGSITVFRRDGDGWHEEAVLAAPNSRHLDRFGVSIATDGQTIVVTSMAVLELNDWVGPPSGVYVFAPQEAPIHEPPPEIPPDDRQDEGEPGIEDVGVRPLYAIDNNYVFHVPFTDGELSASAASSTRVALSWSDTDAESAESGYRIYQWDGQLGRGVLIATLPRSSRSHSVENLNANQSYFFSVEAFGGGSSWLGWQTVRTPDAPLTPGLPRGVPPVMSEPSILVADSSSQITVSWSSADDADGYRVYQWDGEKGVQIASLPSEVTTHTVSDLPGGSRRFFTVEAFNSKGSTWSSWRSVSTLATDTGIHLPQLLVTKGQAFNCF